MLSSGSAESLPIGAFPQPIHSVVCLILSMRDNGRQMRFIGLTNTLLDDSHALLIAGALRALPPPASDLERRAEVLEMQRMAFSPEARGELQAAAERAGVDLKLSLPNGPALRGLGLWP